MEMIPEWVWDVAMVAVTVGLLGFALVFAVLPLWLLWQMVGAL